MTRQIIFKAGEVNKIDPRFIGSFQAEKLLLAKKTRLESQRKYQAKREANGGKPLKNSQIEKLKRQNKKLKISLAGALIIMASSIFFVAK